MPVTLQIKVKPNAKTSALEQLDDGSWRASLKSPPVDGKANAELIKLVAKQFGCAKSRVTLKSGQSSRLKTVVIEDAGAFLNGAPRNAPQNLT